MQPVKGNYSFIRKAAVLGSGVMGSRIACHLANAGLEVLLLDIPGPDSEGKDAVIRNKLVNDALRNAIASRPSPLFLSSFADRIKTGNFEDHLHLIGDCDWILEAVVEKLEIKQALYEKTEAFRKPGSIISSNTSGIPLKWLAKGRSEDFNKHFCGTHFFNPPRYLPLLEIIPGPFTDPAVLAFMQDFGSRMLGKSTVLCKDTPAFIANRIGVFSMLDTLAVSMKLGLSIPETDKLTGPVIGHPKSATFRTADVVGLDTLVKVADGLNTALGMQDLTVPDFLRQMLQNKWLGDKSGQGFYKKEVQPDGKKEFYALNPSNLNYEAPVKTSFATLDSARQADRLEDRWKLLISGQDKAGQFYREMLGNLFWYSASCLPEISDTISQVDAAITAGFGWETGPFATWHALGFETGLDLIRACGKPIPSWVENLAGQKVSAFFLHDELGVREFSPSRLEFVPQEIPAGFILLRKDLKQKPVFSNSGSSLHDLGDGIACLEFHSKMNTLGSEVVEGLNKAFDLAEEMFRGLVIGNQGANFSAGANLGLVFMYAMEQEFDEIDFMVQHFQNTVMRVRYSGIPVVLAPHGLSLGGACELTLHADAVQACAETYMGLVEVGVGLIPAGGGTKEMARRVSKNLQAGDPELNRIQNAFMSMAMAKVSESAHQALDLGYLQKGDRISMNKQSQIGDAKSLALSIAENGYCQPVKSRDIRVQGRSGMAGIQAGIHGMELAGRISAHDRKVVEKLNHVLNGGNLSMPQDVNEQYLLDLEREAFLSLCGERKTLERMQSLLSGGKIIRN
jgi:3-hydroxyacyl-CoA dehydrogenase